MIVGVLTTRHTQHTWDRSICVFLFNRTTLQVFVTYLTGALYVHPLWFYKHWHDNRVRSKLFVACQRWWFQWQFAAILVNCAPSGEMHNYCTPHIIKENFENFLIHRCKSTYSYLKYIVYDKLLKPRQPFWITLTYVIISRSFLLRMTNVSYKRCRENQNTHFMFNNIFFFRKSCRLWDNVWKLWTAGQSTGDRMAHAHRMLGK